METFELMVNNFTDEEGLMNFAATLGIQDSLSVRLRLFQIRNPQYDDAFVNSELDTILENVGGPLVDDDLDWRWNTWTSRKK